jgi:hypothetical protein
MDTADFIWLSVLQRPASPARKSALGSLDMSSRCPTLIEADTVLSALWRYWDGKRAAGVMPRRRDLDPLIEIPKLLPHLLLVERIDGRFRWRLVGSAVVEAYGQELSGRWVDEVISAARRDTAHRHYATVFDTARPIFARNRYISPKQTEFVVSRICMPLAADDGVAVHQVLQAQTFEFGSQYAARLGTGFAIDTSLDQIEFLAQ